MSRLLIGMLVSAVVFGCAIFVKPPTWTRVSGYAEKPFRSATLPTSMPRDDPTNALLTLPTGSIGGKSRPDGQTAEDFAQVTLESYEAEFGRMLRSGRAGTASGLYEYVRLLHNQIVAEPRDEAWASEMEWQWAQFFSGKPEIPAMGELRVFCRSTMCEVRLLGKERWPEFASIDLERFMMAVPNGARRPCGMARAVVRDDLNGINAVVAIIDLNIKACGRAGRTSKRNFG